RSGCRGGERPSVRVRRRGSAHLRRRRGVRSRGKRLEQACSHADAAAWNLRLRDRKQRLPARRSDDSRLRSNEHARGIRSRVGIPGGQNEIVGSGHVHAARRDGGRPVVQRQRRPRPGCTDRHRERGGNLSAPEGRQGTQEHGLPGPDRLSLQPDYSAAPPPSPGTYYVGSLAIENGVVAFAATDATCHLVGTTKTAITGSITFTAVGNRYAGSYDLTFDFGEHVTGTFDAPVCAGADALDPGTGTLTCQ